jgi:hypothetical protein
VVRLLLFRCADVTRYRLPNHRFSSAPLLNPRLRSFLPTAIAPRSELESSHSAPATTDSHETVPPPLFHRGFTQISESQEKGFVDCCKIGHFLASCPESERVAHAPPKTQKP